MFYAKYHIKALEDEIEFLKAELEESRNLIKTLIARGNHTPAPTPVVTPAPHREAPVQMPAKRTRKRRARRHYTRQVGVPSMKEQVLKALSAKYGNGEFDYYPASMSRQLLREGNTTAKKAQVIANAISMLKHEKEILIVREEGENQIARLA